jgi:hypothetical protein
MALRACREHRRKRMHASSRRADEAINTVREINRRLKVAAAAYIPSANAHQEVRSAMNNVEKVQIDGREYVVSELSEAARQQLNMVRAVDLRLADLQRDLAITQTARGAYVAALAKLLPSPA